jgi:hypothetical protein
MNDRIQVSQTTHKKGVDTVQACAPLRVDSIIEKFEVLLKKEL